MILKIVGALLLASPFIALFILITRESGVKVALAVYGIGLAVMCVVTLGAFLLKR